MSHPDFLRQLVARILIATWFVFVPLIAFLFTFIAAIMFIPVLSVVTYLMYRKILK